MTLSWRLGWILQAIIGLFLLWQQQDVLLLVILSALWLFGLMAAAHDIAIGKIPTWLGGLILCLTSLLGYWFQHEGQAGSLPLLKRELSVTLQIFLLGMLWIPVFWRKGITSLLAPFDALWIGACLFCLPLETVPLFLGLTGVLLLIIGFSLWGKTLRGQKLPMIPAILLSFWFCLVN